MKKIVNLSLLLMVFTFLLQIDVKANDEAPIIGGVRDFVVQKGESIDYKESITIVDNNDYLTIDDVIVIDQEVDLNTVGVYFVYYYVVDSDHNTTIEKAKVVVVEEKTVDEVLPTFNHLSDFEIVLNTANPDYLRQVEVLDGDINITDQVVIDDRFVKLDQVGSYPLYYIAYDQDGNVVTENVMVTVIDNDSEGPQILGAINQNITINTSYDPLNGITAIDLVTGDMTSEIQYEAPQMDLSKLGSFNVIYTVNDLNGNTSTKQITINVVDDVKPTIKASSLSFPLNSNPDILSHIEISDNYDQDIEVSITENGLNINKVGTYLIRVNATDNSGNTQVKDLFVYIYDVDEPMIYEDPFIVGSAVAILVSLIVTFLGVLVTKKKK